MSKKKEQALNALIQPIRKWLAGNNKRNALVILSQLCDTLSLILDESMHIEPVETNEPDWEDTIDYTASSSGRPEE